MIITFVYVGIWESKREVPSRRESGKFQISEVSPWIQTPILALLRYQYQRMYCIPEKYFWPRISYIEQLLWLKGYWYRKNHKNWVSWKNYFPRGLKIKNKLYFHEWYGISST